MQTKKERLLELKVQDKLYKELDKYFDAGWRQWVRGIEQKNNISNIRMFKILASIKSVEFVKDLTMLMTSTKNKFALLTLTKKPKGMLLKDSRFKTIPEIMIDKYPSGSYRQGKVFIQINTNRWVCFVF